MRFKSRAIFRATAASSGKPGGYLAYTRNGAPTGTVAAWVCSVEGTLLKLAGPNGSVKMHMRDANWKGDSGIWWKAGCESCRTAGWLGWWMA